jgi:hypothetical protein
MCPRITPFETNKPAAVGIFHGDEVEKLGRLQSVERAPTPPENETRAIANFLSGTSQESFRELFRALAPRILDHGAHTVLEGRGISSRRTRRGGDTEENLFDLRVSAINCNLQIR